MTATPVLRILGASDRPAVPWRNGGGLTREVARMPADSPDPDFDWRISVAEIESAGPFSRFEGVDRQIVLIGGTAMRLLVDGVVRDLAPREQLRFAGESDTSCELPDGPTQDLNVMTRRGRMAATVDILRLEAGAAQTVDGGDPLVLLATGGSLAVSTPTGELARLDPLDALLWPSSLPVSVIGDGLVAAIRLSPVPAGPLVALISATAAAIGPATEALAREVPQASVWNLLDDRLLKDADDSGGVTDALAERMNRLIAYAIDGGADVIQLTCSLYGPTAHAFPNPGVPVFAPDDAAFATALSGAFHRVLVVGSFETAARDARRRLAEAAEAAGVAVELEWAVAAAAFAASSQGDAEGIGRALVEACQPSVERVEGIEGVDAVFLAQYSLAPGAAALAAAVPVPVISGPDSAARLVSESWIGRPVD